MIGFENVRKEYAGGTLAVEDFSLEIASHESVVLVGSSGSGKTTLMRMINRMVDPTAGRVHIDGDDVAGLDPVRLRRSVGYVMADSRVTRDFHVADLVRTGAIEDLTHINYAFGNVTTDLVCDIADVPGEEDEG